MHNVTMRRVRATIVTVGKQRVLHNLSVCICSSGYPARNSGNYLFTTDTK